MTCPFLLFTVYVYCYCYTGLLCIHAKKYIQVYRRAYLVGFAKGIAPVLKTGVVPQHDGFMPDIVRVFLLFLLFLSLLPVVFPVFHRTNSLLLLLFPLLLFLHHLGLNVLQRFLVKIQLKPQQLANVVLLFQIPERKKFKLFNQSRSINRTKVLVNGKLRLTQDRSRCGRCNGRTPSGTCGCLEPVNSLNISATVGSRTAGHTIRDERGRRNSH